MTSGGVYSLCIYIYIFFILWLISVFCSDTVRIVISYALSTNNKRISMKKITLTGSFFARVLLIAVTAVFPMTASAIIIDFENVPSLSTGPSTFAAAGPAQDITVGGITFSGGVVLGFPTNFPAAPFSTPPNLYGTAYFPSESFVGDGSLQSTISIVISPSLGITTVEGLLFNGLTVPISYTIEAFSGTNVVDSVSFNLAGNWQNGFDVFRLNSGGLAIDLVTITPDLAGGEWDYFIDTIAFGEPIENILPGIPEPETYAMLLAGLAVVGAAAKRRRRQG
jgi:hypothetical protein